MKRLQRRALGTMAVISVAVTLVACSAAASVQESSNGRLIAISEQASSAQEDALAMGTVAWGEGECMVVEVGESHLIVFPQGTTIGDNDEVTLPNGHNISAGDEVVLGGGFHSAATTKSKLSAIPGACLTDEVFWASGEVAE